jgi:hypothetical protein
MHTCIQQYGKNKSCIYVFLINIKIDSLVWIFGLQTSKFEKNSKCQ